MDPQRQIRQAGLSGRSRAPGMASDQRPLRIIDHVAMLMGTVDEIAAVLHVDKETFVKFQAECPEVRKAFERKLRLRCMQPKLAKTWAAMAIHLGELPSSFGAMLANNKHYRRRDRRTA